MMASIDYLAPILERKRRQNARRHAHLGLMRLALRSMQSGRIEDRGGPATVQLRRAPGSALRVIAEVKFKSPSAGLIRVREAGAVQAIARQYAQAGAAAVSVLCDTAGFGGSALDVRRAGKAVSIPLLFKEFVLEPIQVTLARELGAHMVLLLVRALPPSRLGTLVDEVLAQGMAPVVEAADETELELALGTRASIIGVNARDLKTFRVDPDRARRAIERIPKERVAVHMSGITSGDELARVARSRADAVLVGEALMRSPSPGALLREWLDAARSQI